MTAINGTSGDDTLKGGGDGDYIQGIGGDDRLAGLGGGDTIYGGLGQDTLAGGGGDDFLYGGIGGDSILGGAGADTLVAFDKAKGEHGDYLDGGNGDDSLLGGSGDTLIGGLGQDSVALDFTGQTAGLVADLTGLASGEITLADGTTLSHIEHVVLITGGKGGDSFAVDSPGATIDGGGGDDHLAATDGWLVGGSGRDTLDAGVGISHLDGGLGNDVLIAAGTGDSFGGDTLLGGEGDDRLQSLGGGARLDGGAGDDQLRMSFTPTAGTMIGGTGADKFIFTASDNPPDTSAAIVTLADLADNDLIDLRAIDADVNTAGNQAFVLVDHLTGVAGQAAFVTGTGGESGFFTLLVMDIDGDGRQDFMIEMDGDQRDFTNIEL